MPVRYLKSAKLQRSPGSLADQFVLRPSVIRMQTSILVRDSHSGHSNWLLTILSNTGFYIAKT